MAAAEGMAGKDKEVDGTGFSTGPSLVATAVKTSDMPGFNGSGVITSTFCPAGNGLPAVFK